VSIVDTYEARISKMKMDINNERTEKFQILKDYNTLKDKYNQEVKAGNEIKYQQVLQEKAALMIKFDKMGAELDSYKLRLIENEIKAKRETLERLEISNARRIKTKYKRMRFIGEPKTFQEILGLMNNIETYPLKSKERLAALEEFCIYGNAATENLDKLRNMNGPRHAAKSLASTDASIVVRALCLGSLLTKGNENSCQTFLDFGAINYIIEYLNSSNENFRVEALQVLE
jgi:hypothetical protein